MERPLRNPLPMEVVQVMLAFGVVVLADGVVFGGPLWQSVATGLAVAAALAAAFSLARRDSPDAGDRRRTEREDRPE